MTIELLIHAIVRQTTVLIAQLATARGLRAPLAQVANQVFLDLVAELERQGVSRTVSADMFGLGLRTYRRKIQRLSESSTERGRSLWEVVLEYVKSAGLVSRRDVLGRFPRDDERQVRAVLHDLCESQLVFASGSGANGMFRAASAEELVALQQGRGAEGADELVMALMYREGPVTVHDISGLAQVDSTTIEATLARLVNSGRVERVEHEGRTLYRAGGLVIPLGAPAGWEAAVFDHFKAMVKTIIARIEGRTPPELADGIGGSTYTMDVWDGHPLTSEVYGTLARLRGELSELRARVQAFEEPQPEAFTRAVIYVGQSLTAETNEAFE
jgi:hypothetical protein